MPLSLELFFYRLRVSFLLLSRFCPWGGGGSYLRFVLLFSIYRFRFLSNSSKFSHYFSPLLSSVLLWLRSCFILLGPWGCVHFILSSFHSTAKNINYFPLFFLSILLLSPLLFLIYLIFVLKFPLTFFCLFIF